MRILSVMALMLSGAAAWACPAPPDHAAAIEDVLTQIRAAKTEQDARLLTNQLWELWTDAPDEAAQAALDTGISKRASYDFLGATQEFDRLVAYCPDYAEGYNQRAFVNFMREDYQAALTDLDVALRLSPTHVAAMTGKALALMGLNQQDQAQQVLKQALALNPWLPERHLLAPPKGEKL
ncbi:hypothetical protein E7681_05260 [Thalassobius vesicularis]|uniref:Uncharacterized protein n=1 Tax=Thalassobius vesicularis TaxID=1294297 RepID=A0A4S3MC63_9RHOB|nr:tetratricopeptide repeat protein [Thalassobius vesicularis]THD75861.1 hypothetical protein E7681_05260 [Thalassobius vesicularis]